MTFPELPSADQAGSGPVTPPGIPPMGGGFPSFPAPAKPSAFPALPSMGPSGAFPAPTKPVAFNSFPSFPALPTAPPVSPASPPTIQFEAFPVPPARARAFPAVAAPDAAPADVPTLPELPAPEAEIEELHPEVEAEPVVVEPFEQPEDVQVAEAEPEPVIEAEQPAPVYYLEPEVEQPAPASYITPEPVELELPADVPTAAPEAPAFPFPDLFLAPVIAPEPVEATSAAFPDVFAAPVSAPEDTSPVEPVAAEPVPAPIAEVVAVASAPEPVVERPEPATPIAPAPKPAPQLNDVFSSRSQVKPSKDKQLAALLAEEFEYPDDETADVQTVANMWVNIRDSAPEVRESGDLKKWYERLFIDARSFNTSDLHLETFADDNSTEETKPVIDLRIRMRVDGSLLPFKRILGPDAAKIMGVIKTNANGMSTSGSTTQESQIVIPLGDKDNTQFETRATIAPKADGGEILNVRLPIEGDIKPLKELGMSDAHLESFRGIISHPHGLVLVAGPTGSGKTTTIHAALTDLLRPNRTIFTLEDPVERFIPGMVQIEVSSGSGAGKQSFSEMLPYMVRFDYDMLFLGEIRDKETAQTAIKQAQIGKMVFATIHANDNVVALQRLITLVEDDAAYVLDSVRGVVSQRLIAKRNPHWDGLNQVTRYSGRTPIHEVTEVTPNVVQGFVEKLKFSDLRQGIRNEQNSSLAMDAVRLLKTGVIDMKEARRVLGDRFLEELEND